MKQTNINIDEIKRFPTVTNPIKADDLHTPQAYAFTLRRAIVTDCNEAQRAALVELLDGKDTAEGVTFNNTQLNRDRLHIWQNQESRRERAAILGEGWQYSGDLNDGTPHAKPGDEITCIDGTTGICTKASPEIVCIEFETADGRALTVAGYFFRKERTPLQDTREITEQREQNDACISSAESRRDKANGQIKAAAIVREQQDRPGHVNTSWATDYTPEDFEKLTSRYEIADEDRDIVGRRFHTGEGLWTVDVFVSDYAGNEAHALIYLLTGDGQVRANVLNIDHLRQTLTEAKGWTRTA